MTRAKMSLRKRIRDHLRKHKTHDDKVHLDAEYYDDQSDDSDTTSLVSAEERSQESAFSNASEKQVYENQLTQLQEQLVSLMIDNQNMAQELKQNKENESNEWLRCELEAERNKNKTLRERKKHGFLTKVGLTGADEGTSVDGIELRDVKQRRPVRSISDVETGVGIVEQQATIVPITVLPAEDGMPARKSRFETLWERTVDRLYDIVDDFSIISKSDPPTEREGDPLSVKTLKENLKRFKVAIKPFVDTFKGFNNLVRWKSPSYTLIVFCIYLYSVWKGWFLSLLLFLAIVRIAVGYLHFKYFEFKFSYLDPGEPEKENDDPLGLSDKFNLVLLVATKVQNGMGYAADSLEKIKNLLTWRHFEGTKKVFTLLCICLMFTIILPPSYMWTLAGFGIGYKVFIVKYLYDKYPRLRRKHDSNLRLWRSVPTDAQYDRLVVKTQMDRYIVIPRNVGEAETTIDGHSSSSDSDSDSDISESLDFRELFSLPPSEYPVSGWRRGKRVILMGKERSFITLLTKKRGKLYLTNSFLCFEREKDPSPRNIVIPLQDIVSVDAVKLNKRLPGRGMAMQILLHCDDGIDKVFLFGGIIGRDDVVKNLDRAIQEVKQAGPLLGREDGISRRTSAESTNSGRIQDFTFGAYYEDSE